MAESADALDSGSSGGNTVEVQVLSSAYKEGAYTMGTFFVWKKENSLYFHPDCFHLKLSNQILAVVINHFKNLSCLLHITLTNWASGDIAAFKIIANPAIAIIRSTYPYFRFSGYDLFRRFSSKCHFLTLL